MNITHMAVPYRRALAFVSVLITIFTLGIAVQVTADDGTSDNSAKMVMIYDRGVEQTIITRADTVKGALEQAGITLSSTDITEPAITETLVTEQTHVNIFRSRPVVVTDGTMSVKTVTAEQSPVGIAKNVGLTVYPEDETELTRVDNVLAEGGAGMKLTIDRATVFTLDLYGKRIDNARSQAETVGELLVEKNIVLGKDDGMSVTSETPLVEGMSVRIWRNGVQTITVEEETPMPIEKIKDHDREVGYKEVKTPGKPGKKQVTYEVNLQNGVEVSRKKVTEVETLAPVKQVEVLGVKFSNTFSGDFAGALARLRMCEAGGVYDRNSGNGYYGAYQYDIQTWGGYAGFARADLAPPAVQDQKVWETYQRRGWQPWPSCKISQGLQDIYR